MRVRRTFSDFQRVLASVRDMTFGEPSLRSLPALLTDAEVTDLQRVASFQVVQEGELFRARFDSERSYLQVAAALRFRRESSVCGHVYQAS